MARRVWMLVLDELNPNHYYYQRKHQKIKLDPAFPAKMKRENTNLLAFVFYDGNFGNSCYQHNNNNIFNYNENPSAYFTIVIVYSQRTAFLHAASKLLKLLVVLKFR